MQRYDSVSWMFDIKKKYGLLPETLALAIYLFDSCYSLISIKGVNIRIYRAACMSVASKYEETLPPSFRQLGVYIYEHDTMTNTELSVLQANGYSVSNIRHPVWYINNMCIMMDVRYKNAIELVLWAMADPSCHEYTYLDIALEAWKITQKKYKNTFWPNLPMRETVSA